MKLPISLDESQFNSLEIYLGRKPTSEDIKLIIAKVVPNFPESKPHGGARHGAGRKRVGNAIEIPLSITGKHSGKYTAIVDVIDADLAELNWQAHPQETTTYAKKTMNGKQDTMLHGIILERILGRKLEKGEMADHINCNGLDNRRENLRLATKAQNMQNRRRNSNSKSGYKGVSWDNIAQKWLAQIRVDGKTIRIGHFDTPEDAHKAYCEKAKEYFGDFSNFG